MNVDFTRVKPYGDTLNDGMVQLSFTLPVPYGEEAREAARQLAAKMGMDEPQVYHMKDLGEGFSFFIVYGKCQHTVDYTQIRVPKVESKVMNFYEINQYIREKIGRKIVVVGACTGTDAHTVGIDAIMNMKGYHGEYGLERYPEIDAYNLGSQVPNEELIKKAIELNADVLLVSQVVTQKGVHVTNLTHLVELLEVEGLRDRFILICGGPRISHELALELGFDAGFGPGSLAPQVASYFVQEIAKREQKK
ncbi:lysine 5,6-aminomutase subunit beta [Thermoflavimicrobium dichotomicum]|uniref:Beta-lysine 5,6-aminomutase beta subunit n=1 Tax=Thermoflavimicrobium dichotomicum TaxID=46223 RepID=A0A1I3K857_9BACL|nr:OAM dimerization domain-containing protein [Thermoflavimicrobium dichotomicum]SFI68375.1 beta-lysine 5,6-aminomutase beta subunit [Thermoflavimicrobium dichotomicum]